MNLSPRNKLIALIAVIAAIIIAMIVLLVAPRLTELGSLDSQITTAEQEASAAQALLEQRQMLKQEAAQTDTGLIELANAIPEQPDLPSMIIEMQDLAHDSGVVLRRIKPGEQVKVDDKSYYEVPVQTEVWGTWADTVDYLQRLKRLTRQVRVTRFESVSLRENDVEEASMTVPTYYQVSTSVDIMTYVIPSGASVSPAPGAVPVVPAQ